MASSFIIRFRNPSYFTSNLDLANSISRARAGYCAARRLCYDVIDMDRGEHSESHKGFWAVERTQCDNSWWVEG